jgi:hypothetical protein
LFETVHHLMPCCHDAWSLSCLHAHTKILSFFLFFHYLQSTIFPRLFSICTYLYFPTFFICVLFEQIIDLYILFPHSCLAIFHTNFIFNFFLCLVHSVIIQCSQKGNSSRMGLLSGQSGVKCRWEKQQEM